LKEALAACNGILELRDAALAAAEAMGLSYEVLGLFSAGLTLLLAIIRAVWVHYRGTPFVVDRIDQLVIIIIKAFFFSYNDLSWRWNHSCIVPLSTSYIILLVKDPAFHALFYKLYDLYFILLFNFELVINRLVERLVVGIVDIAIAIYRGTVVRLTAVGDAIVSLGRRITRRQPSTGVQVFIYFNILC
jgi:hypothetical protein